MKPDPTRQPDPALVAQVEGWCHERVRVIVPDEEIRALMVATLKDQGYVFDDEESEHVH